MVFIETSFYQAYYGGEANCAEQLAASDDYDPTELVCPACANVGGGTLQVCATPTSFTSLKHLWQSQVKKNEHYSYHFLTTFSF